MDIRLATLNDAESIAALNAEVQHVHADALPHLFKPPSEETFPASLVRQLLADPNTYIFIASANDAPVGYLYGQILRRAETSLHYAWDPTFKGSDCPCRLFGLRILHTTRSRGPVHHR